MPRWHHNPLIFAAVLFVAGLCTIIVIAVLERRERAAADTIVMLQRFSVGAGGADATLEAEFVRMLVDNEVLYVPPPYTLEIMAPARDTAALVAQAETLVQQGHRWFFGCLSSDDLRALLPLARATPDAIFISTCSTSTSLALPDNVLRLACPDGASEPYMVQLLRTAFPSVAGWRVQAQAGNTWAQELAETMRRDLPAAAEGGGVLVLTEAVDEALTQLAAADLAAGTPVVFGDAAAYAPSWAGSDAVAALTAAGVPLFALTSLKMLAAITAAHNMVGNVGPFVANLMLAGRLLVQAAVLRSRDPERAVLPRLLRSRSADNGTGMFDGNGDRLDIEVGLVQWKPDTAWWTVVQTAGKHAALGPFSADFSA